MAERNEGKEEDVGGGEVVMDVTKWRKGRRHKREKLRGWITPYDLFFLFVPFLGFIQLH